jgi:hypothetical protein
MSVDSGANRLKIQVVHYPAHVSGNRDERSGMVVYLFPGDNPGIKEKLAFQSFLSAVQRLQDIERKQSLGS